ncbi:GNAT family N-acetyltransferase [Ornithinibacillus bavariensis]|uniref:N-acetyltransferase n=1 Tax=Ornithinibacillus bavariensis TaxID=545502 RepID=A0A920C744_9BACI|nr:GNAT family N-acetyltransferase [Ornithinibacillus bavariensis]GIO27268.1 N-acetyltransferase [Ornithinibacillus bavariensis]
MKVREAGPADAGKLAQLIQQVEKTSQYMLWEPEEREIQPENQRKMIERFQLEENSTILIAENNSMLVGYLFAIGGDAQRKKHSAYLVIGIHEQYRGKGVGTLLFNELDKWAIKNNMHRLELTVVTRNKAGLSLYQKVGFEIEGTKRDSLSINGEFFDEYYMAKLF